MRTEEDDEVYICGRCGHHEIEHAWCQEECNSCDCRYFVNATLAWLDGIVAKVKMRN